MRRCRLLRVVPLLVIVLVSACAPANTSVLEAGPGFWRGLVHGWVAPVAFIGSLFRDDIGIYAIANSGGWYDFGFLFGLSFWGGGGGAAASRRRRKTEA